MFCFLTWTIVGQGEGASMTKQVEKIDTVIARSAYESMCRSHGKTPGKDVPSWSELGEDMKKAWGEVGQTVVGCLYMGALDVAKEQVLEKAKAERSGDQQVCPSRTDLVSTRK